MIDKIIDKYIIVGTFIWFAIQTPPSPSGRPLWVLTHDTPFYVWEVLKKLDTRIKKKQKLRNWGCQKVGEIIYISDSCLIPIKLLMILYGEFGGGSKSRQHKS